MPAQLGERGRAAQGQRQRLLLLVSPFLLSWFIAFLVVASVLIFGGERDLDGGKGGLGW